MKTIVNLTLRMFPFIIVFMTMYVISVQEDDTPGIIDINCPNNIEDWEKFVIKPSSLVQYGKCLSSLKKDYKTAVENSDENSKDLFVNLEVAYTRYIKYLNGEGNSPGKAKKLMEEFNAIKKNGG